MFCFTTCTGCGDLLHTVDPAEVAHEGCTPARPPKLQRLLAQWLALARDLDPDDSFYYDRQAELDDLESEIHAIEAAPPRLLEAALVYASWDWPVFPLAPGTKIPVKGGHGCLDASTDEAQIRAWWAYYRDANIGLATGHRFDVVDIDPRHGGLESLYKVLAAEGDGGRGLIPDTHGRTMTAGGGYHYYIEPLGGGNKANMLAGIDIRGKGGYVVAPPSQLDGEHRWSWLYKPSPKIRSAHT